MLINRVRHGIFTARGGFNQVRTSASMEQASTPAKTPLTATVSCLFQNTQNKDCLWLFPPKLIQTKCFQHFL